MKLFWKVHIRNFDEFVVFICNNHKKIDNDYYEYFKDEEYGKESYLYFSIEYNDTDKNCRLTCLSYCDFSYEWYICARWEYMGEYMGRYKKLKRLNEISGH